MAYKTPNLSLVIGRLLSKHTFFASLLLRLMKIEEKDDMKHAAATDEQTIFIHPTRFNQFTPDEGVFVMGHEVLHKILFHVTRGQGYKARTLGPDGKLFQPARWAKAVDFVVNSLLVEAGVGTKPAGALYDPIFNGMSADEVYRQLPPEPELDDDGTNDGGMDGHEPPPPGMEEQIEQSKIDQALATAAHEARAQGTLSAGLQRLLGDTLQPKLKWKEQLWDFLKTHAGASEASWSKLNRRRLSFPPHLAWPGKQSHSMGPLVVGIDTSGSIGGPELDAFMAEVKSLYSDLSPETMHVMWCDTAVAKTDEVMDIGDFDLMTPAGGGGTHMPAIFDEIEAQGIEPEAVVILTDGYTNFDDAPAWPVAWVITSNVEAPYGRNIKLEL